MPRRRKRPVEGTCEIQRTIPFHKHQWIKKREAEAEECYYKLLDDENYGKLIDAGFDDDAKQFRYLLKELYKQYDRRTVGLALKFIPKPRKIK